MYKIYDDYPVQMKIRIMAGQVYAAAEIGMWCFDEEQNLYYSTCPNEKEFLSFLKLDGCLEFAYERKEGWDKPVILSDFLGLLWIAEHIYEKGRPYLLIIMGPVFFSRTSMKHIEDSLRKRESSVQACRQMSRMLSEVPVLHVSVMNQYAAMLHYTITDEMVRPADFYYQNELPEKDKYNKDIDSTYISLDPDRVTDGEKHLLNAIRTGNKNYREIIDRDVNFGGGFVSDTGNVVRDGKNTLLVLGALCSRAAMEGGVPVKIAKEMEMYYAAEIEKCDTISRLSSLNIQMLDAYVNRVQKCRENPQISGTIQECCDYIRANVNKPLTVEEIAGAVGYTPYYFTKKFNKEMEIRVTDYIKQARIEYAKIALISTKKSIQEISDFLQFGTRNYFSKVFHDIVGMTPAAYREHTGREERE
ncbi:helix-turn-helix transcriptional regulator [Blautia marasmi]|uniref:helix-turn-helix transcriptional regulator n=1 Tax=Blautia marasmi TaxID=1917868 RepID=UPI00266BDAEE|nr:AraC family transcriptional regulator [Blautia marasmi]